jgi:3-deoxy-D-manno-octulosonate 8-phosphate phosphatase KdsC-like HAD superfamily phosphatase
MSGQSLIIITVEWFHVRGMGITLLDCTDQDVIYFTALKSSCVVACSLQLKVREIYRFKMYAVEILYE